MPNRIAAMVAALSGYKKAREDLRGAYESLVKELTIGKRIAEAKATRDELLSLSKSANKAASPQVPPSIDGVPEEKEASKPSTADAPNALPQVLQGAQSEALVVLHKTRRPHELRGIYRVSVNQTLRIEAGAFIACAPNSELVVAGQLAVEGTRDSPVVFESPNHVPGSWKGIRFTSADQQAPQVGLHVLDANAAISATKSRLGFEGCVFANNSTGIDIGDYGSGSELVLKDCVCSYNQGPGIRLMGSRALLERTSITHNKGRGITGEYYASVNGKQLLITQNAAGGIWLKHYECRVTIQDSVLFGNGGKDAHNEGSAEWNLSRNFWGPQLTGILVQSKGTGPLMNVVGKATYHDFLNKLPEQCGATMTKFRGRPIP